MREVVKYFRKVCIFLAVFEHNMYCVIQMVLHAVSKLCYKICILVRNMESWIAQIA
jgi:hypothetical protein